MRRAVFALLLIALSASALGQSVFRWIDHEGRVHYGHAVPPEYRSLGFERLAPDGRVLEYIPPEMTPEEREAERQRRQREEELRAQERAQAARDRALLSTYRSEEDLIETRDLRLNALQTQSNALETSLNLSVQRFEDLVARAAELNRQSRPVPAGLEESITETQNEMRRLREAMAELEGRMDLVNEHFEAQLARYRLLTGNQ